MSVPAEHRAPAGAISCAVITCSDTRTESTDRSGPVACTLLEAAGHLVSHRAIVREDPGDVLRAIGTAAALARVVILTGGTGVAPRDGTVEAVLEFVDRELPGFGELFRHLSYAEIGAAAMLSRAVAGTTRRVAVFALPGSSAAVRLGMERLIVPELNHIIRLLE